MECKIKAKELFNCISGMHKPIPGYQERRIHLKKAIALGTASLIVIAATFLIAYAIFSGSKNPICTKISAEMSKSRCFTPLTLVGSGFLAGSLFFTSLTLANITKFFKLTVQTKSKVDGKDSWKTDDLQPIYLDYDPKSPACYLYKNEDGILTATSEEIRGRNFIEKKEKSIYENPHQVIYGETMYYASFNS